MINALKKLIDVASGNIPADSVIKNCKVVNVYSGAIEEGDIAICDGKIAGVGNYEGKEVVDAEGKFASPCFIDGHIHIESSYLSPEELGRMIVPRGTGTIMADPHEIANVCGERGLSYMLEAGKRTALNIIMELPSCVPATPFDNPGKVLGPDIIEELISKEMFAGLGEMMNFPGVLAKDENVLAKLAAARKNEKWVDGHGPGLAGNDLNGYAVTGIISDHECSTLEEMNDRLSRGMYILMRQGSTCHNLRTLIKGVNAANSRRCILCSDDLQPKTIIEEGHIDNDLRICVNEGIDPVTAIRMATLNPAECFGLKDRGAIAPGKRADIVLLDDLTEFKADKVWIEGKLVASKGEYLPEITKYDIASVKGSVVLKDFSKEKLKMHLRSNHVNVIGLKPGGIVTEKFTEYIKLDDDGEFVRDANEDIAKVAVIERHNMTGNAACGFIKGYGIKEGAVAISIGHDSHNIITVGVSDDEMETAVNALKEQEGGIVLVKGGKVIENMPAPIAGLMSDQSGEWVSEKLKEVHRKAHDELGINKDVEPIMALCFMTLIVIPSLKITDTGLFDVSAFRFIPVECD